MDALTDDVSILQYCLIGTIFLRLKETKEYFELKEKYSITDSISIKCNS